MKQLLVILAVSLAAGLMAQQKTFHQFSVEGLDGSMVELSQFKGKKILVVNTASKCGLTPQYEDLQKLFEEYQEKGLVVIGFPANNFMNQEPGTNEEIATFCEANYGVTFPMMTKISVKGDDMHPIYRWLTSKSENGVMDSEVKWNFQKYLIDEEGRLVDMVPPREKPQSEKIIQWIKG
ncbi:MAG: glutathione peroxidase [Bacteroidales bacterium]|nr:glutathione peroxidase [Bacteroidales bacterium]